MIFERIESEVQFAGLSEQWNALLKVSSSDCVFLTHEWLFTWWKHLGGHTRPYVLLARDGHELIGILPLVVREPQYARMTPRVLEFLGSGLIGSDYLDVIIKRGREDEVCSLFSEHLHRRGLTLHLSQVRRDRAVASHLAARLSHTQWASSEYKINVCPFIDLSGMTWDSYLGGLGSSQRYNFNRRLRNLTKQAGFQFRVVHSSEEAVDALATIVALHEKRWGSKGDSEAFQTPATIAFHREFVRLAAERGWLRLLTLSIDGVPTAALYGLRYGGTFYFYQSGFDPAYSKQSVGLVMMGLAIKTAIEEGAVEYDFLHGSEDYKFHWAKEVRELGRIELYPPHTRGKLCRRAIELNRAARRVARRVLK